MRVRAPHFNDMNPMLKYRGGKGKEIAAFKKYLPCSAQEYGRYIEPFLGGGAVFFHIQPEKAIINDINPGLMTFYQQVRDLYPEMREQLGALQEVYERNQAEYLRLKAQNPNVRVPNKNEDLYYALRQQFNAPTGEYLPGVLYFFINKTAYSGMIRYNKSGEFNVPYGRYPNFNTAMVSEEHSKLLQAATLYNTDFADIFAMANENDFMFLDPPYDCIFNDYGNTDAAGDWGEEEHERLAAEYKRLPCRTLMIIGKTSLTERLYKPYIVEEYHKNYSCNIRNRFKSSQMHLIVKNW